MQPDDIRIETPRLVLRPLRLQDFDAWAVFSADPAASRFLGGPQSRAVAWRSFMTMAGAWYLSGFAMFSVLDRASGEWLGRLGPWMPEGWPGTEVGWGLIARRLGAVNRGSGTLPAPLENFAVELWGQSREQWRARRPA